MRDNHISVPKADLVMAMDDLRQSGRDYSADLLKKALLSPPVSAEPVGLPDEVLVLMNHIEDVPQDDAWNLIDVKLWNTVTMLTAPVAAQEKEEAARYRWLRDRNDWHAEPRLNAEDGTIWRLTFYTPAPIIDPTDDDSLDVALIAAMLSDACGSLSQRPVAAAQPDITQQTLDDVKAGIPARDAEIEALREELETLQAVQAQQPVSQLMPMSVIEALNKATGSNEWQEDCSPADLVGPACAAIAALAQQPVSGTDQFRNAAQMIESSGNSGELDELKAFEIELRRQCFQPPTHEARDLSWCMWQARAALAQQDADKVDTDPLQGAADWLVKDCGVKYIAELARRLSIGYNRATRLMEAARKEAAHG